MDKTKTSTVKTSAVAAPTPVAAKAPSSAPAKPPPLFRRVDWVSFVITFLFTFVVYYLTIAPEMTLEDSGELATGSFYAGIPHPPGYPVWTLYTFLWTKLLPIGNIAWRVGLSSAFAGAMASALLALVVSRGSSMIIESIDDLKTIARTWENAICIISGFVAGCLIGFNGYMWSQSVIVEVYPLSVVSLMFVVVFLMRWVYAPHQHRYLYWAFFAHGICTNNHQSLLVICMGMEVLAWRAEPKLGREMFFWNTLLYLGGIILRPEILWGNVPVAVIFNVIGISSAALWVWETIRTKKKAIEIGRDLVMVAMILCFGVFLGGITNYVTDHVPALGETANLVFVFAAGVGALIAFIWLLRKTKNLGKEWAVALACGGAWIAGAAFYLYMPIAGAMDPPMQWGYPRTVEGFFHAITRGQYEKIHPTSGVGGNAFEVIGSFISTYSMQLWRFMEGLNEEFNLLYLLIALVVFLFYRKMKRRERVWITGMIAIFVCIGPFLVLLLNFSSDRQSLELNRVFLTSSHVFVAMSVGFGLTLLATSMAAHFDSLKKISILGAICALDFALFMLTVNAQKGFDPDRAAIYGFAKVLCWLAAIVCVIILWRKGLEHDRLLSRGIPGLFIFVSLVLTTIVLFGDPMSRSGLTTVLREIKEAFDPNQYGLPILSSLILVAAGGIFLFCVLTSRSKAPLAITLVLFALMPTYSLMTHWYDNEERNHYFGYWFGHDMFTPPFVGPDGQLTYDAKLREQAMKGPNGNLVYPEMARDTILFGGTDPGRFAPTYMIFCDSFIPDKCKPAPDPAFDRRDVYIITQNALADVTYLNYIRAHYYRSDQFKYDSLFFQELLRSPKERADNYSTNILASIAGTVLDGPIQRRGAAIEARWRKEGVYPKNEIYTPTPQDSQKCFQDYLEDAQRRLMHDQQNPYEPRQIRPGEQVTVADGKVQVSGQVAVMAINGLLTKVIFDHNPTNEFYVEESFPLDWMYPHLTPFGIIMKINRQPLPSVTEDIMKRDHEFWAQYSQRLIGNWITYDTPVKDIAAFAEKVYLDRDSTGFKGDTKFLRDDQAQKAFSKLRSSIAGIYAWRLGMSSGAPTPEQYLVRSEPERQRMIREAEFAFKQAFAFCPYSPEAVFRYVQLLANLGRIDDAILVAETCQKLDPYNGQITGLVQQLKGSKANPNGMTQIQNQIVQMEEEIRTNPANVQKTLELAVMYMRLQQPEHATELLDSVVQNPHADVNAIFTVAQMFVQMNNVPKLETTMEKLVKLAPDQPEAWYNLAAVKAALGKQPEAFQNLKKALELSSARRLQNTNAHDLHVEADKDPRFAAIRAMPEYQTISK
jgi:tetratricopeptide (TPR) repeat protein